MTTDTITEKRHSSRKIVESGIAVLLHPDIPIEIARVIDISPDGLSFSCVDCHLKMKEYIKMDILLINEDLFLDKITSSVVSDTPCDNSLGGDNLQKQFRYGVKFRELQPHQRHQLNKLAP